MNIAHFTSSLDVWSMAVSFFWASLLILFGYINESTIYGGALSRCKLTSRAPLIRKFGKPIKPRKFGYDASPYEQANAVQTLGRGREVSEKREREWQRARINRQRSGDEDRESRGQG